MKKGPVLLLSGWAHGEEALSPVSEALAGGGRVESFSLASLSLGHDAEEGVSSYARTVSRRLDKWGEPARLVGWSTGGMVAIETAALHPEKVACLVLLSATARFCSADGYPSGVKPAVLRAMIRNLRKNPQGVVSDFISRALQPMSVSEDVVAKRAEAALAGGVEPLAGGLEYLAGTDLRHHLDSIGVPCLIIHGKLDMIVPFEAAEFLNSNIPGSRMELFSTAGHCLIEQCGDGLIRRIARFVEGT